MTQRMGSMKVLICGSRDWTNVPAIMARVADLEPGTIVIHGAADGADANAGHFARKKGLFVAAVPVNKEHWALYGRSAGHKRNHAMLDLGPDLVIAFQHDGSGGTQGTIDEAQRRGIPVEVYTSEAVTSS